MNTQSVLFFIFLIFTSSINSLTLKTNKLDSRAQTKQIKKMKLELINSDASKESVQYIYDKVSAMLEEAKAQQEKHNSLYNEKKEQCEKKTTTKADYVLVNGAEMTPEACLAEKEEYTRKKEEINKKIEEMNKTLEDLNKVLNDESGDSLSTLKDKFIAFLKEKFGISLVQFDLLDRAKDFVTSAKQNGQAQDSATVKVGDYGVKGDLSYKDGKLQGSLNLFGGKQQQKTQAQPQKVQTPSQPIVDDSEDILVKPTQTQTVQSQPQKVQSQPQTQTVQSQPQKVQTPSQSQTVQSQPQTVQSQPQKVQTPSQPQTAQSQPQKVQTPSQSQTVQSQPQKIQSQPQKVQSQPQTQTVQSQPQKVQTPSQPQTIQTPSQSQTVQTPSQPQTPQVEDTIENPEPVMEEPETVPQPQTPVVEQPESAPVQDTVDEPIDESKESEQIISSQQPVESSELPTIQEVITPVEQPKQEESFVDYIKDIIKKIATYKLGLSSLDSVKEKVSELKAKVESGIEEQKAELAKLEEKEAEYGNCEPAEIQVPNEDAQCARLQEEYNKQLENRAKNVALLGEVLEIVKEKMDTIPKGLLVTYYDTESFFRGQKPLGFVKPIMHQLKAKFLVQPEQQKN